MRIRPRPATALLLAIVAPGFAGLAGLAGLATATPAAPTVRCFGAAAMDPQRPCVNGTLSVVPDPDEVKRVSGTYCAPIRQQRDPEVCTFGTRAAQAKAHVALIGDSHALHWRSALDRVARAQRWHAYSITAAGCFYSESVFVLADGLAEACIPWYRSVARWLAEHREVTIVVVSHNAPTRVELQPGESQVGVKSAGFQRAWRALPAHVKRLLVIRDTPRIDEDTLDCVNRVADGARQRAGLACAVPRRRAVVPDPAVAGVRALRSRRYGVVDMTDFFCGPRRCYPVIGGVLVPWDVDHINATYARTLGPYLLREFRRLTARR